MDRRIKSNEPQKKREEDKDQLIAVDVFLMQAQDFQVHSDPFYFGKICFFLNEDEKKRSRPPNRRCAATRTVNSMPSGRIHQAAAIDRRPQRRRPSSHR